MIDRDWSEWCDEARALLTSNLVRSNGHRYTRPAPSVYEQQWLWDSCFHAIVWRWLDPAMAHDELRAVVAHQLDRGADAGMVPHMTYWAGGGETLWQRPERSVITQPPLIAVAAEQVLHVSGDDRAARELLPAIRSYHDWFDRRRDPDGDDLVSLIHPWETGWDAAPRWNRTRYFNETSDDASKAQRHALVADLVRYDCDALALAQAGYFHVEAIDYNTVRAADLDALSRLEARVGDPGQAALRSAKAARVRAAVRRKMLLSADEVVDLEGLDEKPIGDEGAAKYVALFGRGVEPALAAQLAEELRAIVSAPIHPIPTVPPSHPQFGPGRYWRGNVWPQVNWLVYMGLRQYGHHDIATRLAERTFELVEQSGFREYFNPLTGEGCGSHNHSWTTLVLDMLARETGRVGADPAEGAH